MNRIAIIQSAYIPWKGYFDIIRRVDTFILYDAVQYTTRDWRNRNRIKTSDGLRWLTVPVLHTSRDQRIGETEVANAEWAGMHWKTLQHAYRPAPYFSDMAAALESLYTQSRAERLLSRINHLWITAINEWLGIRTPVILLTSFERSGDKSRDLANLCAKHGADIYVSGPSARDYLDIAPFTEQGIGIEWMDYSHYKPYPVIHPPFEHRVSILDLLAHTGPDAVNYL